MPNIRHDANSAELALLTADASSARPAPMHIVLHDQQECFARNATEAISRCPTPYVSAASTGSRGPTRDSAATVTAAAAARPCPPCLCDARPAAAPPLPPAPPPRLQWPCDPSGAPTLSLDGCSLRLPLLPQGPLAVVHVVRNPWDAVTSAFWFHMQDPAPPPFGKTVRAPLASRATRVRRALTAAAVLCSCE